MNNYQRMIAYLKIVYNNLTTLHRNLVDDSAWFANHEQIGEWYSLISDIIDDLAEAGIMLDFTEPSISDSILQFSTEVLPVQPRELKESFKLIDEFFRVASGLMLVAESDVPADVQNKLQEYEYVLNKISKYKLRHALGLSRDDD